MSWTISETVKHESTGIGLQKALDQLNAVDRTNVGNQQCEKERDEQIDAAIKAAFQLIVEGGFANAEEISMSLAGHANKDHEKEQEWANDYISIQVHIKRYRSETG